MNEWMNCLFSLVRNYYNWEHTCAILNAGLHYYQLLCIDKNLHVIMLILAQNANC